MQMAGKESKHAGAGGTLLHEADMDWGPGMLALAESLSTHAAHLYRYQPSEQILSLVSTSCRQAPVPHMLPAADTLLREILQSREPFYNETRKYGEVFSAFRTPYLILSSLQFEKKILGLLVVQARHSPSRQELDFLSAKALHFSLLLAIEEAGREKAELQKKAGSLEGKLEAAYQRLGECDKLASLGQFAGGLAHELNTPLGAIRTYAEYLQIFVKGQAEQESLEGILKAVAHCREIVENVLRLSRNGRRGFEPLVLRHVVDDALILAEPEMEKHGISVGLEVLANPVVLGNHTRLVQVVANLLSNARDALVYSRLVPRKGGVKVTLSCDDGNALIDVVDNGPGIPKKILGQVFNPFFTTKDAGAGTGLGLSISHAMVKEHSGSLEILSEEGLGTRVIVKIPLLDEHDT